jgi:hypothetical protein
MGLFHDTIVEKVQILEAAIPADMGIAEIPLKEKCYQRPKGSIRELYRIGRGLPSSHTMVPGRAAEEFLKKQPSAPAYRVTLFDSLAATGKGHLTFQVLRGAFADRKVEIAAEPDVFLTLCWQSGTGSDGKRPSGSLPGLRRGFVGRLPFFIIKAQICA